ncbi:uncharacterized protein LOC131328836 isoform X1 [Rhododendron vialii]|uniref:uncharacterized protein LOC131328836 isoform X1 n=1 Tax=Rhododendron vialii TaxID=182163 RepID=UPI00265E396B|nr:uncharacterized protein LOC131328836 isoform X1 [Rhododendron vialii]
MFYPQNSAEGMAEAGADCSSYDLEEKIEKILSGDDEERLISFLTTLPLLIDGTPQYCRHHLLDNLCMRDNVKCATALLEGKLGGLGLDLDGDHLLHRAARFCSSDLVQLFLHHKARSDTRYSDYRYDRGEDLRNGLRPLDIAFNFARSQYPFLESYPFGGQSTFQMILYLCQLGAGHVGDTIKFLACSSEEVAKEAYHYARKGKLIELALLLIVAREKILVPIDLYVEGGVGSSGRTTILHWLQFQILILTYEEKLMGDCKNGKSTKIRRDKMVMRSAALLLEVFGRAGHAIEEIVQYLSRSPFARSEELEKHAVFWLKEAGFKFKNGDFDFSTMDWFDIALTDSLRTMNRTPTKDAPSAETDSSTRLPFPQQKIPSLPLWGWSSPFLQSRGLSSTGKSHYTNHIPKSISRSQYSASLDVLAKKQTEPIEQNVPQCLSKLKLARVARLLRRGIRIA